MIIERKNLLHVHQCKFAPEGAIGSPVDEFSQRIYENVLASASKYLNQEIPSKIPFLPDSPFPYHNLYLSFYTGMQAAVILPHEALAYRLSGNKEYLSAAKRWLETVLVWDTDKFSFYIAARLMHALICTADWLRDDLSAEQLDGITELLRHMCLYREDEALAMCRNMEPGGHANLYVSGFGLSCLYLRSCEPKTEQWLAEVISKYEKCLLPHDWSPDGAYPPDGTWTYTYAAFYKFAFLDAYKAVTGRDLVAEYRDQICYPTRFLRYAYLGGETLTYKERYTDHENMADKGYNLDSFSPVYLWYASLTRDPYLQWIATRDPRVGSIIEFPNKVKQGPSFIYNPGLLAWFWYDPSVEPENCPPEEGSALFSSGELAILRTGFSAKDFVLSYQGRRGNIMYESPGFSLNRGDHNFFVAAPSPNTLPTLEENALAVSGEMERKGCIRKFVQKESYDELTIDGFLTRQRIRLEKTAKCVHIHAEGRKPTERERSLRDGYVSLDGGYLQYARSIDEIAGSMTMRFRLKRDPSRRFERPFVLFSTGQHLRYSFGHCLYFGFLEDGCLGVKIKDAESRCLFAQLPRSMPLILRDRWYDAEIWWKNLNTPGATPLVGIRLEGVQTETSLAMPDGKAFVCRPNTSMWVGAGLEMPDSFAPVDISRCELFDSSGRSCFLADYSKSVDAGPILEESLGPLEYRLHLPVSEDRDAFLDGDAVVVRNGEDSIRLTSKTCTFAVEEIPYARPGFAADSFEDMNVTYKRVLVLPPKDNHRCIDFTIA